MAAANATAWHSVCGAVEQLQAQVAAEVAQLAAAVLHSAAGVVALVLIAAAVLMHGILDYYEASDLGWLRPGCSGVFNRVYQSALLIATAALFMQPLPALAAFILFTVYHFGEDARYLLAASGAARAVAAVVFGASTLGATNYAAWQLLVDFFQAADSQSSHSGATAQGLEALVLLLRAFGVVGLLWLLAAALHRASLLAIVLALVAVIAGPGVMVAVHLTTVHVPLAVYRIVRHHGIGPLHLWLASSAGLAAVVCLLLAHGLHQPPPAWLVRGLVGLGIGLTMPHMAVTSLWQRIVDGGGGRGSMRRQDCSSCCGNSASNVDRKPRFWVLQNQGVTAAGGKFAGQNVLETLI